MKNQWKRPWKPETAWGTVVRTVKWNPPMPWSTLEGRMPLMAFCVAVGWNTATLSTPKRFTFGRGIYQLWQCINRHWTSQLGPTPLLLAGYHLGWNWLWWTMLKRFSQQFMFATLLHCTRTSSHFLNDQKNPAILSSTSPSSTICQSSFVCFGCSPYHQA